MQRIAYMTTVRVRTPKDVGALIKARRKAIGLGQAELATLIGASRLWVSEIENGKPGASLGLVLRTLSVLGLELSTDDEGKFVQADNECVTNPVATEMLRRQS
jgi:HTH-type transcriptional regulator / antitoxin HipB